MKFLLERCKYWNGEDMLCDPDRKCCQKQIFRLEEKGCISCFKKPFTIQSRDQRYTPEELLAFIMGKKFVVDEYWAQVWQRNDPTEFD